MAREAGGKDDAGAVVDRVNRHQFSVAAPTRVSLGRLLSVSPRFAFPLTHSLAHAHSPALSFSISP
eukprot:314666-Rhodomonas_salina.2